MARVRWFNFFLLFLVITVAMTAMASEPGRWPQEKAKQWYSSQPWLVGSNFLPSTAINELEMWQADTFDAKTIDHELSWAESIGMNTMRVFLHNLPWTRDSQGFLDRMEKFLQIADKHHIRTTFVLLDSVWDPYPQLGKQRAPRAHVHNSGWVQAPGAEILKEPSRWDKELKPYVTGVLAHFRNDHRVLMWDLMNEPDNDNPPYRVSATFRTSHRLHRIHGEAFGQHIPDDPPTAERAARGRVQLGLCFRKIADHLSVGFVGEAIYWPAASLVS